MHALIYLISAIDDVNDAVATKARALVASINRSSLLVKDLLIYPYIREYLFDPVLFSIRYNLLFIVYIKGRRFPLPEICKFIGKPLSLSPSIFLVLTISERQKISFARNMYIYR